MTGARASNPYGSGGSVKGIGGSPLAPERQIQGVSNAGIRTKCRSLMLEPEARLSCQTNTEYAARIPEYGRYLWTVGGKDKGTTCRSCRTVYSGRPVHCGRHGRRLPSRGSALWGLLDLASPCQTGHQTGWDPPTRLSGRRRVRRSRVVSVFVWIASLATRLVRVFVVERSSKELKQTDFEKRKMENRMRRDRNVAARAREWDNVTTRDSLSTHRSCGVCARFARPAHGRGTNSPGIEPLGERVETNGCE